MVLRPWNWTTPGWLPTYIPEGRRGRPPLRLARLSLALCFSLSLSGRPRCRRAGGPTTGRLRGRTGHPWIGPWIGCAGVAGWLAGLIHSRGRTAGGAMEQSPSNNRSTPQTAAVPSLDRLPPALIVKLCVSIGLEGQETMDGVPPPPPRGVPPARWPIRACQMWQQRRSPTANHAPAAPCTPQAFRQIHSVHSVCPPFAIDAAARLACVLQCLPGWLETGLDRRLALVAGGAHRRS